METQSCSQCIHHTVCGLCGNFLKKTFDNRLHWAQLELKNWQDHPAAIGVQEFLARFCTQFDNGKTKLKIAGGKPN